ncbi:SDR family oxidoreductase [Halorientalis litorea]|jgi:3-oxoacyl-[acyl-carrier protein] reductase|uniref:SDR family oxidoreductase n=1 Tax=Halorientalis litorea TaxID=2931977 RepID=UPI001FF2F038|nr:SDR family oxidoreductase [Halorientalis litorea]
MNYGIDGNAALVTASSSGLGKASAKTLAREGVDVVVNGRDPEKLDAAVEEVREAAADGVAVVGHRADITDPEAIVELVNRPVEEFGRLDHLVTSAGGPPRIGFFETTDEDWYETFDLLVMAVVRAVWAAEPHLRADGGGTIVSITSLITKEASPSNPLSSCIRMATMGVSKCLSYEFGDDVRVNAIMPGLFDTPRREDSGSASVAADEVPLGRFGDAMELGELVAFLSSDLSSYVTGAAIPVDGGALDSTQ